MPPALRRFDLLNLLERVMGIEPTLSAWEAEVLPLNYTRLRKKKGEKFFAPTMGDSFKEHPQQRRLILQEI